ncbi:MAG: exodeoxyribonuclease VII large subunit [Phaeodactylibacter sp.]|nr:exodeoxyribonuclease VII large subunit [Phaeodactylibacter sp.]
MLNVYSLFELNTYLRRVIAINFQEPIWIQAEIAQVSHKRHFFIDLVQKAETGDGLVAQSTAFLWERKARSIQRQLPKGIQLEALLQTGMEVKVQVRLQFEERYGLQLIIEDLDPTPTLGKLAMLRAQTLARLEKEGLLTVHRSLSLPRVVQRIAVLSSPDAAGLKDFQAQLANNPYQYAFDLTLFPILVQGEQVAASLKKQVEQLEWWGKEKFDCLVLIRGGGSKLDLAAFDDYEVCRLLTELPIPLITGIGHETDESLADLLAHKALKTPTAVAEFLLYHNAQFESRAEQLVLAIRQATHQQKLQLELQLQYLDQQLQLQFRTAVQQRYFALERLETSLQVHSRQLLQQQNWKLQTLAAQLQQLQPDKLFKRGFNLILKDGQAIQSIQDLRPGDTLDIQLQDGQVISTIQKITSHGKPD